VSKKKEKLVGLDLDSKRVPFEEIAAGHTFKLRGAGRAKEGEHFWCAFCGGRGKNYYEVERDDDAKYQVGERCLGLVGLAKRDLPKLKPKKVVRKKPKTVKEEMPEDDFSAEALDKLLENI
jgi:hypothetical protein